MWDEPDTIADDDDDVDEGGYQPDQDLIAAAVGASGYAHRHTIQECARPSSDSRVTGFPEIFERFYFDADGGPVLIDIVPDDSPDILREERARVHADFKERWCAQHNLRYLALGASDLQVEKIRRLLAGTDVGSSDESDRAPVPSESDGPKVSRPASQRTKTPAKRGQIQRPKATA